MGLLDASLINALLARPVSLDVRPFLGMFAVVPYSFHFQVMDWVVLCKMFKAWAIFSYPNLHNFIPDLSGVFLWLHDAVCSLMFSNKPLRLSQNSCIYTKIRLHTGGLHLLIRWLLKATGCTWLYLRVSEERGVNTFVHHTFLFFICKKKKLKPCIIFLPHNNYAPLCIGLSHKIPVIYIYICGYNVKKCGKFKGGESFCKALYENSLPWLLSLLIFSFTDWHYELLHGSEYNRNQDSELAKQVSFKYWSDMLGSRYCRGFNNSNWFSHWIQPEALIMLHESPILLHSFSWKKALSWHTKTFKNLKLIPRPQENLDLSIEVRGDFFCCCRCCCDIWTKKETGRVSARKAKQSNTDGTCWVLNR